jgi:2-hydroxy-6-oxonona-2,4-dienedioate hydrolase
MDLGKKKEKGHANGHRLIAAGGSCVSSWHAHMPEPQYRSTWTDIMAVAFVQGYVSVNGLRTRYLQAGNKSDPAVVLLHGTGANWEIFSPNIAAISNQFHCLTLDLLGHGLTDKPAGAREIADYIQHLVGFLDLMGVKKASFIGTSLGAWIAARMALQYPERVEKIVLLSPGGLAADLPTMQSISSVRKKAVEDPSWDNIAAVLKSVIFKAHNVTPDMVAVRQAIYQQPSMRAAMASILALQDPIIRARNLISREEFSSITCPTLVIASSDDVDVFVSSAYTLGELIPGAQLIEMQGVGHMPQFEDPSTFNQHALAFLNQ